MCHCLQHKPTLSAVRVCSSEHITCLTVEIHVTWCEIKGQTNGERTQAWISFHLSCSQFIWVLLTLFSVTNLILAQKWSFFVCVQARVREDLVMDILWNTSAGHIPHLQQSHLLCVYQPTPQPNTNTDGPFLDKQLQQIHVFLPNKALHYMCLPIM